MIFQCIILVTGQTLWKTELDKYESLSIHNILNVFLSWRVILGLAIYVAATVLWFYIISIAKGKFSVIYPLGSLAYVLGVVVALLFFKEQIPVTRWVGVAVVLAGVYLIAK